MCYTVSRCLAVSPAVDHFPIQYSVVLIYVVGIVCIGSYCEFIKWAH